MGALPLSSAGCQIQAALPKSASGNSRSWRGSSKPIQWPFQSSWVEHARGPAGGLAPGGGLVVLVPDLHLPVGVLVGGQGLAGVGDGGGGVGGDLAGVPEVGLVGGEQLGLGGDQDLVGGLGLGALGRSDDPAQAGAGDVEAQGVDAVLAAQAVGGDGGEGRGSEQAIARGLSRARSRMVGGSWVGGVRRERGRSV